MRRILLNTSRLSDLVGNILLLSKLDNSSLEQSDTLYRLDEQIRLAIVLLEDKWVAKEIELDVDLDETEYYGCERLLAHVWSNLIDNAIKYSPDHSQLRISTYPVRKQVVVSIIPGHQHPALETTALG